jgi:hypothetical protein
MKFIGVEKIFNLNYFIGSLVILEELLKRGQIVMHIHCICIEVNAY